MPRANTKALHGGECCVVCSEKSTTSVDSLVGLIEASYARASGKRASLCGDVLAAGLAHASNAVDALER